MTTTVKIRYEEQLQLSSSPLITNIILYSKREETNKILKKNVIKIFKKKTTTEKKKHMYIKTRNK
jgi:hypothetical protein